MKKITIVALYLGYGGIEKAIASFCNMLCDKYEIEIISTYKLYSVPPFAIDDRVKITYLMKEKPNRKEFFDAIKYLDVISFFKEGYKGTKTLYLRSKKMIDAIKKIDSDIIISTRPLHNKWVGLYGNPESLKIAWEHSHHNNNQSYIKRLIASCQNLDYLVPVSEDLTNFYRDKLPSKTKCVHISLTLDNIPKESSSLEGNEIISIAKLSKEKGLEDLIDVFALVHNKFPDWKLNIIGDGPERNTLLEKIKESGLEHSIITHGYKNKNEIHDIIINNSLYVMTSFSESFGLVLLEAMSYGVPCIAFDSAQGAREIIDDDINGYLISNRDKEAMANKIIELIKNDKLRKMLGKKAKQKARQYSPSMIKEDWLKILK